MSMCVKVRARCITVQLDKYVTLSQGHGTPHTGERTLTHARALVHQRSVECVHAARHRRKRSHYQPVSSRRWIHAYGCCFGPHVFVVERVRASVNVSLDPVYFFPRRIEKLARTVILVTIVGPFVQFLHFITTSLHFLWTQGITLYRYIWCLSA